MTGNMRAMYSRLGLGVVPRRGYLNGKSTTINGGDLVVMTTNATYTTASNPVVRSLVQGDINALYAQGSAAGILGVALHDAVTTSGGVASTQFVYSAKAAAAEPVQNIPSYGMGQPADTNISYTNIMVALALPDTIFRGKLSSANSGTATMSNVYLGPAGFLISSSAFYLDTNATTKIVDIIGWDPSNTSYAFFTFLPAYCQLLTGVWYTSQ